MARSPETVVGDRTRVYLYDSASGELVAELAADAAAQLRDHPRDGATLEYDGSGHLRLALPMKDHRR